MGRGLHRLATAGVAAAVTVFCSLAIESQAAQLLTTITAPYPGLVTRSSGLPGSLPGLTLLTLQDPLHGDEPWVTDGTPAGTRLLLDVWPGPTGGLLNIYFRLGDVTVFAASDGVHGRELWRTDGTAAGTYMLADIAPGPQSYEPTSGARAAAVLNGVLYFGANDTFTGWEVWRTDGTREGTYLFADLEPGYAGSHADHFIATSTHVYFSRQNPGERWVTDGTPAGTRKLADVQIGFGCMVAGDAVFCPGTDHRGTELWHASGDGSDLRMVANLHTGGVASDGDSDPHPLVRLGDAVLFFAQTPVVPGTGGGGNDHKLFSVDLAGSAVTELLNVGHRIVNKFIALPRGAMFSVSEGPNVGDRPELWITDGTPAGTRPLDLDGLYYSSILGEEGDFKVAYGPEGEAYFHGRLPGIPGVPEPDKIWRTDGTREGTHVFADLNTISQEYEIAWLDGRVYFDAGAGGTHPAGNELWTSDGTTAGTHMVRDIAPNVPRAISSLITDLRAVNGRLMFYATRTGAALEPWSSDGTQNGTVRLTRPDTDINEPADAIVEFAGRLGSQVVFASNFGANVGRELGITDGTASGTRVLHELKYAGASSDPADFLRLGDHLLFTASANNEPRRMWRTDGTPAGTVPLSPDNAGVQPFGGPDAILGGVAYWPGGNGLWRTDGTTGGTFQVDNTPRLILTYMGNTGGRLLYQARSMQPDAIQLWSWDGSSGQVVTAADSLKIASARGVRFDDRVCFRAWNTNPQALDVWCSNGIADDAVRLTNLASAARSAVDIHTVGDRLLVNAAGADPGLYATQVAGGTQRIADVWIRKAAMLGTSRLVFTDDNRELWVTDGTSAGTRRLLQGLSLPGIPPGAFGVVGDHVVFVVNDSARGATLWRTDGTSAGTRYLLDLDPGTSGVSEETFKYFAFDDRLMFSAFVPDVGNKMWSLGTADPNASDDAAAATGGAAKVVEVLDNDADFDGSLNPATVTVVTPPAHGTATVNATTGAITYTATTSYSGADSLTYRVSDDQGKQSNVATVSFQVTAGSSPPANPPPASGGGGGGGALGIELWGLMMLALWSAGRRRFIQYAAR